MILKTLSRKKAGSSKPVIKYIFRYILDEDKTGYNNELPVQHATENEEIESQYRESLESAGVAYTDTDIQHLISEQSGVSMPDVTQLREEYREALTSAEATFSERDIDRLVADELFRITGKQEENEKQQQNKEPEPFIITHNLQGKNIDEWVREFEDNEAKRIHKRSNATHIQHVILSFGDGDKEKITDDILRDLITKFIELRGTDLLYAATKHLDKEHVHAHIAVSGTRTNGLSARISKRELAEIKEQLQSYQQEKYGFLNHSLPEHGRSKRAYDKAIYQDIKRNERFSIKNMLLDGVETLRTATLEQMLTELQELGYTAYYRLGALQGVQHGESNLKFRFSTLGVDVNEWKYRDQLRYEMEQEMQELDAIRYSGKGMEMTKEDAIHEDSMNTDLEEIEDIRGSRDEAFEQEIGNDDQLDLYTNYEENEDDSEDIE